MQAGGAHGYKFFSFGGYGVGERGVAGRGIEGVDNGGVHSGLLRLVASVIFAGVRLGGVMD
jgi:hypothetical protein